MPLFRRKQKDGVEPQFELIGGPRLHVGRGNPLVETEAAPAAPAVPATRLETAVHAPVSPARVSPAPVRSVNGDAPATPAPAAPAPVAPIQPVAEPVSAAPPPAAEASVAPVDAPPGESAAAPAAATPPTAKPATLAPVAESAPLEPVEMAAEPVTAQFAEDAPAAEPVAQPAPAAVPSEPIPAPSTSAAPAATEPPPPMPAATEPPPPMPAATEPPPVAPAPIAPQPAPVAPEFVAAEPVAPEPVTPRFVAAEPVITTHAAPPVAPSPAVAPAPEPVRALSTADYALARKGLSAAAHRNGNGHGLTPVISVQNITKIYQMGDVEVAALRGVNLEIFPGEMTAVMGPSGSGKSTLMNIIGCLDVPTDGTYLLDGTDVSRLTDDELADIRARKIGFVFQSFNLLARTTALANVELPLIYAGAAGRVRHNRAEEALQLVGLGDRAQHKPNELSGGQQQRVAIARALINDPAMILADEPTGNLDTRTSVEIMELFQRLNVERGMTIVFVTHNIETADYCHRVIHVRDGVVERDVRHEPRAGIYRDLLPENMAIEKLRPSIGDEEVSI